MNGSLMVYIALKTLLTQAMRAAGGQAQTRAPLHLSVKPVGLRYSFQKNAGSRFGTIQMLFNANSNARHTRKLVST